MIKYIDIQKFIDSKIVREFNASTNVLKNQLLYGKKPPRDLFTICQQEYENQCDNGSFPRMGFANVLNKNIVCSYGLTTQVECPHQDDKRDANGFFQCMRPEYAQEYLKAVNFMHKFSTMVAVINENPSLATLLYADKQ